MKEQVQFDEITVALDRLEKQFTVWSREQFRDAVSLVEYGSRVRALKNRVDTLDKLVSDTLKPRLVLMGNQMRGEHCVAELTVYSRSGFDHKSMQANVPKRHWEPYVTSVPVQSITYKVL